MNVSVDPFAGPDPQLSEITVADLEQEDIESILNYWYGPSSLELQAMLGIELRKLPSRRMMREMLALKVKQKNIAPTILATKVRGISIGVHELTHIEPNVSSTMHVHIWKPEHRGRGIGVVSYVRAMQRFFDAHGFQRIIFETPVTHLASNKLKQSLGISPSGAGAFFIPTMAKPIETLRYEVERSELEAILDRVERNWKYRPTRNA